MQSSRNTEETQAASNISKAYQNLSGQDGALHLYNLVSKNITAKSMPLYLRAIQQKQQSSKEKEQLQLILIFCCNMIGAKGCLALSKANIKNISILNLDRKNMIRDEGCKYLSRGDWPDLQHINLNDNKITEKGCIYLSKTNWNKLKSISLTYNRIGKQGFRAIRSKFQCKFLYDQNQGYDQGYDQEGE